MFVVGLKSLLPYFGAAYWIGSSDIFDFPPLSRRRSCRKERKSGGGHHSLDNKMNGRGKLEGKGGRILSA